MRPMILPAFLALAATGAPCLAQNEAEAPPPRGTYLVYADEEGSAFASYEPSLAESSVWPLSFFYFQEGALAGTARIAASADCAQGIVGGRLTHATGPDGTLLELPQTEDTPTFSFDRAGGSGDEAIVAFVCGTTLDRMVQAEAPILGSPEATARLYAGLRALGVENRLAQRLAIRNSETAEPLISSAVPEALRAQVRELLSGLD